MRVRILSRGPPTFVISPDLNRRPQTQLQAPHMEGGGWTSTQGFQGDTDSQSTAVHLSSRGSVVLGGPLLTQGLRSGLRMGDMRRQTTQQLRAGSVRCPPVPPGPSGIWLSSRGFCRPASRHLRIWEASLSVCPPVSGEAGPPQAQVKNHGSGTENKVVNSNVEGFARSKT